MLLFYVLPVQRRGAGCLTMPPGLGWAVCWSELGSDWMSLKAGCHSRWEHGSRRSCMKKQRIEICCPVRLLMSLHTQKVMSHLTKISWTVPAPTLWFWQVPEAFAGVSLLERRALWVKLLSSSTRGRNHHLLITRYRQATVKNYGIRRATNKRHLGLQQKLSLSMRWGNCVCVCECRTARDAGIHLSKAGVSLLGKKGFCLVNVLACLVDATAADAGHRHLRWWLKRRK